MLIAWLGLKALSSTVPEGVPHLDAISLDLRVLLFTAGLTLITSLLFAVIPAIHVSRIGTSWRPTQATTWSAEHQRMRTVLVSGQMGIALVLLVGAGLMIHSFVRVLANDLGAESDQRPDVRLSLACHASRSKDWGCTGGRGCSK